MTDYRFQISAPPILFVTNIHLLELSLIEIKDIQFRYNSKYNIMSETFKNDQVWNSSSIGEKNSAIGHETTLSNLWRQMHLCFIRLIDWCSKPRLLSEFRDLKQKKVAPYNIAFD